MIENGITRYGSFIKDIKNLLYSRQYEAMKRVNAELIHLYWEIGKEIDRQQREQGWGKSVVEILAKELQKDPRRSGLYSAQPVVYAAILCGIFANGKSETIGFRNSTHKFTAVSSRSKLVEKHCHYAKIQRPA